MECGKLTAKLRDAVPVCFIENGKEVKRFKNIEIPDEIKKLPYQELRIQRTGNRGHHLQDHVRGRRFAERSGRRRGHARRGKPSPEEAPMPEKIAAGLQAALEQAEAEGQPVAEIAEAAAQGAEITTELNGQELTITAHEPENMEAAFNVTGERRKALVETVKAFVDAPAVYQNAPSFAYVIGDYTVSKTGTSIRPGKRGAHGSTQCEGLHRRIIHTKQKALMPKSFFQA